MAIRIRGVFETFDLEQVAGTLVGFWTPSYARTINVPGYHLHLLSDDHRHAGHVLELQSRELELELHRESHLQLVLPESPAFLKADLSGDPAAALAKAEGDHKA
ncbi:acetolactate decarboxylase [Synechococcus sp. CBW1004]|uniref:acetolactate decarboxylase n=1 Tax=Synechococcus sp. CBW1004 TaxID=1353136 RepID=UPI001E4FB269|nr:acetolactate decarboxylase [Synechococcus sp. CBW1004]